MAILQEEVMLEVCHGHKTVSASYNIYYNIVDSCEIYGSGSYVGGLWGRRTKL